MTFDGLNRDATITALTGGYDKNGNLTFDGTRTFTYDFGNRLVSESASNTSTTLAYDPEGRLETQATTTGGTTTTTTFLWDDEHLVAEYNGSTLLRRYINGPNADNPYVWVEGSTMSATAARNLLTDHQGTVIGYSDSSGAVSTPGAVYAYDAYGAPFSWGGSRFRYTGQMEIPEAQLYYYKARMYDPVSGHSCRPTRWGIRIISISTHTSATILWIGVIRRGRAGSVMRQASWQMLPRILRPIEARRRQSEELF